jgi:adenylate cyclase class IV
MQNVEVKAPLRDRPRLEARLVALGAERRWTRRQIDTFFAVPRGWLKLREVEGKPAEVIAYERPAGPPGGRLSNYEVILIQDPASWKRLLGRVLPAGGVVDKQRTLWTYENTRIHLDEVRGLGEFIELETLVEDIGLEAAGEESARVAAALALEPAEFIGVPYRDLLS